MKNNKEKNRLLNDREELVHEKRIKEPNEEEKMEAESNQGNKNNP